jgi:transcriptional regulator with XRE-family HTH domain
MQPDPKELGARIRDARLAMGLSLVEVQAKTDVNHGQQSRIERGDFKRYGANVRKLCKFYDLTPTVPELEVLRARLDRAVRSAPTRRALEAVLDAIDWARSRADQGRQH